MNRILKVYNRLLSGQSGLYPPRCALCGQSGANGYDLCPGCLQDLPRNNTSCPRCGAPLHDATNHCGPCIQHPPPFDRSIIPFRYGPPLDHLLQQLKFHQRLYLAPLLGGLLAETVLQRNGPFPELILPVPLHRSRIRERGYNQALELLRPVAKELSLPFSHTMVRRLRATPPQTSLQGKERRKNLRGAFTVHGVPPPHVAIVDDVVTTGATVTELARRLKRAGAEYIEIWAVARAGRD